MDQKEKIKQHLEELERLARAIKRTPEHQERVELLREMRTALDEADRMILRSDESEASA